MNANKRLSDKYIQIIKEDGKFTLYKDGKPYFIKGIGGHRKLDIAKEYGANSLRTWSTHSIEEVLNRSSEHEMTVMVGIALSKNNEKYFDEEYKEEKREEVKRVVSNFKNHESVLIWTLGNEINLGTNSKEAWEFVNELATVIKSLDTNHPVCTVIAGADVEVINNIVEYAPEIEVIGINAYARYLSKVKEACDINKFDGPYVITEWGPTGFWETDQTTWGAPIEETSVEKAASYIKGYQYIYNNKDLFLGSYVFLWGQKEERTPTWFGMFVEDKEDLGLQAELLPTVDAMKFNWTGSWPKNQAPVVKGMTLNGKTARDSVILKSGETGTALVDASDPDGDNLTFIWEILYEATELGFGGSYEPRPERFGEVIKSTDKSQEFVVSEQGEYRLYVYVLDGQGHVGVTNIPFKVEY